VLFAFATFLLYISDLTSVKVVAYRLEAVVC